MILEVYTKIKRKPKEPPKRKKTSCLIIRLTSTTEDNNSALRALISKKQWTRISTFWVIMILKKGRHTFPLRGKIVNISHFVGQVVFFVTIQLCQCSTKAAIMSIKKWAWLCFCKPSFTNTSEGLDLTSLGHSLPTPDFEHRILHLAKQQPKMRAK